MPRSARVHSLTLAAAIFAAGCAGDSVVVLPTEPAAGPARDSSGSVPSTPAPTAPAPDLRIYYLHDELVADFQGLATVGAVEDPSGDPPDLGAVSWSSSDSLVLSFADPSRWATYALARGGGAAEVSASALGTTVRKSVVVHPRPTQLADPDSAPVVITDFRVGEVAGYGWLTLVPFAALQARGDAPVMLLEMELLVSGLPASLPCATNRIISRERRPLVVESYGDWELEHSILGTLTPDAEATLRIIVRDEKGGTWLVEAKGPVRPVGSPTTYGPGDGSPWSCGAVIDPP
jgi:hypothetical protein